MPEGDLTNPERYIYSREEALAACETKGRGLCSIEQILGFEKCAIGWLYDGAGYWMTPDHPFGASELHNGLLIVFH